MKSNCASIICYDVFHWSSVNLYATCSELEELIYSLDNDIIVCSVKLDLVGEIRKKQQEAFTKQMNIRLIEEMTQKYFSKKEFYDYIQEDELIPGEKKIAKRKVYNVNFIWAKYPKGLGMSGEFTIEEFKEALAAINEKIN